MRQEQNKVPQFPSSSSTMFNLLETSDDIDYSNTFYDILIINLNDFYL